MFFTSSSKFLSSACFSVDLQSNVSCLGEGLPILGLMLAAPFLCLLHASAHADITCCTAAFVASLTAWIIACFIASGSVAI